MSRSSKLIRRIAKFNRGRDPERLQLKYRTMQKDALSFLRGSCHLFCEDWPRKSALDQLPPVWVCGDLHLENFGAYRGDDRLVYFDIADFDESALASCAFDLVRMLASTLLAARLRNLDRKSTTQLCRGFLAAYAAALHEGKARWIERSVARGPVRSVLHRVLGQTRAGLLAKRTQRGSGGRRLLIDGEHTLPLEAHEREQLEHFVRDFAKSKTQTPLFRLRDAARRIAGTGALGLARYTLLVEGTGSQRGPVLLDLKLAAPSALASHLPHRQPKWTSEAHRVAAVQQRMQAIAPAFLHPVLIGKESYVLRELMPTKDKLDIKHWQGTMAALEVLARDLGNLLAWSELRSSGRDGSATIDELIGFAARSGWQREVLDYARHCSATAWDDWTTFREAWRDHDAALR